jgi:hypothetical protein
MSFVVILAAFALGDESLLVTADDELVSPIEILFAIDGWDCLMADYRDHRYLLFVTRRGVRPSLLSVAGGGPAVNVIT